MKALKRFSVKLAAIFTALCLMVPSFTAYATTNDGEFNYYVLENIIDLYLETSLYESDRDSLLTHMLYSYLMENPYMLGALANSLLSANDPYSAYYSATAGFLNDTSSKSYGIVLSEAEDVYTTDNLSEGVYITEILPGSNAEFAGILPGDKILRLDGMDVTGLTLTGVKYMLTNLPFVSKDSKDSPWYQRFSAEHYDEKLFEKFLALDWDYSNEVTFDIERTLSDGSKANVSINVCRGQAPLKELYLSINEEKSTAVIHITSFNSKDLAQQFITAIETAHSAGCKNLIFDLRDNPGGYMDVAVEIASLFTKGEQIMYYTDTRLSEEPIPTYSTGNYMGDKFEKYAVLVNGNTASASELLTYILRKNANAVVIGETTFGKALGQEVYMLPNGDKFTITTLEILTPELTSYNEIGITPDIYVPMVPQKYQFPTGLSHFNHQNFVEIQNGAKNDAVLAFEQRMGIIGLMRQSAIDGVCDGSTLSAISLFRKVVMGDKFPDSVITYEMVTTITSYINGYKDKYILKDSQLDVAETYLADSEAASKLAEEYNTQYSDYLTLMEEREEANRKEYEGILKQEQENNKQGE